MQPIKKPKFRTYQPRLKVVRTAETSGNIRYWLIDGYLASIQCWTDKEFEALPDPPADAVHYPEGVWVSLHWN